MVRSSQHGVFRAFSLGLLLLAMGSVLPKVAAQERLTLVDRGESLAPIVVFEDAPPFTRQAADELAEYIERISGARPEVLEGHPDPIPENAIWVGYQPVLDELFPDLDFDFQYPEEILIAANESHLVVAGRDRWHPDHLRVRFSDRHEVYGVQQEYGTANAVYTLLQDHLGVRWLWPGELGVDVIERDTIAFSPFQHRYHPQFRARGTIFTFSRLQTHRGHSREWLRFQRLQLDSMQVEGGHGFAGWWDRFHEDRPEYFALQPDGTRGGGQTPWPSARTVKLCKSNPAVWRQWLADVEEELERNPNRTVFGAGANDGGHSGYCVCQNCLAWDHQDGEMVNYSWQGLSQKYVAQSDRRVTWANTLARMLKERFPERDLYVGISAYGNARPVPVEAIPDDNVLLSGVFNFHNRPSFDQRISMDHRELFLRWARIAQNVGWRPNLGGAAGWQLGMPNVAPRRAIEDMRFAAENNVIRVFFDSVWEHWANQGPHYYMLGQMGWNPYADGEAILADYYQRAFGPAAETMTAYWEFMDEKSDEIVFDGRPQAEVWNAEFYRQGREYLDRATEQLVDAPEVYRRRVQFVRAGLDYTWLYNENAALIRRIQETPAGDAEALAKARANWEEIVQILADHPHAFNPGYISPGRRRLEAVNPDS